jgi:hypothetical protein
MSQVGVSVEYLGTPPEAGKNIGRGLTSIGDQEHSTIVNRYVDERFSMGAIAKLMKRSSASIIGQLKEHDLAIDRGGVCLRCEKVHSTHSRDRSKRTEGL